MSFSFVKHSHHILFFINLNDQSIFKRNSIKDREVTRKTKSGVNYKSQLITQSIFDFLKSHAVSAVNAEEPKYLPQRYSFRSIIYLFC